MTASKGSAKSALEMPVFRLILVLNPAPSRKDVTSEASGLSKSSSKTGTPAAPYK
jgi:hypothetical protein